MKTLGILLLVLLFTAVYADCNPLREEFLAYSLGRTADRTIRLDMKPAAQELDIIPAEDTGYFQQKKKLFLESILKNMHNGFNGWLREELNEQNNLENSFNKTFYTDQKELELKNLLPSKPLGNELKLKSEPELKEGFEITVA
ncbi:MAG: hypothetical protein PHW04_05220 [Candidatus Wallbacteria bacterium]|nr:hypothetical protein [Candidatus Wallbacteria bacterium]